MSLLLGGPLAAEQSSVEEPLAEQWQLLYLGGRHVGSLHARSYGQEDGRVRSELLQDMELERFGQSFSVSQEDSWLERPELGLEWVESVILMNGQRQEIAARSEPGGLVVRRTEAGRSQERLLPAPEPVLGPYAAARRVEAAVAAGGPGSLRFRQFSPATGTIEEVEATVLGAGELVDCLGNLHRGTLVEQRSSGLPGIVTREVYAEDGFLLYSRTDLGVPLEAIGLRAAPDTAPAVREPFEVATLGIPVSELPEGAGALSALAVVRLRFRGEGVSILAEAVEASRADLGDRGPRLLEGGVQAGELLVELAAPQLLTGLEPPPPRSLAGGVEVYLRDGYHLGLDDPRLDALLRRCPDSQADCLEGTVNRFITRKSLGRGFAGVAEILESREGDCTEAAVLLAALLRKLGLPSRLAYGLLLTEAGLLGHAWTEVYQQERWHWLDPSFPGGAPYALKLRVGVLDPGEAVWGQLGAALFTLISSVRAELVSLEMAR